MTFKTPLKVPFLFSQTVLKRRNDASAPHRHWPLPPMRAAKKNLLVCPVSTCPACWPIAIDFSATFCAFIEYSTFLFSLFKTFLTFSFSPLPLPQHMSEVNPAAKGMFIRFLNLSKGPYHTKKPRNVHFQLFSFSLLLQVAWFAPHT